MTPRDRYHRARGYARASAKAHAAFREAIGHCSGYWNYRPSRQPALDEARQHERFAWSRLPENARRQIARPA